MPQLLSEWCAASLLTLPTSAESHFLHAYMRPLSPPVLQISNIFDHFVHMDASAGYTEHTILAVAYL